MDSSSITTASPKKLKLNDPAFNEINDLQDPFSEEDFNQVSKMKNACDLIESGKTNSNLNYFTKI